MPFCPKCGTEYTEGTKFCGKCGENVDGSAAAPAPAPYVQQGPTFFQKILNTKDVTATIDPADIAANKVLAILAYCSVFTFILCSQFIGYFLSLIVTAALLIAPCIVARKSLFCRHHLYQAITYLFATMIVDIVQATFASWIYWAIWGATASWANGYGASVGGVIVAWLIHVIFLAIPVLVGVAGVVNAAKGKAKNLPIIGIFKFSVEK